MLSRNLLRLVKLPARLATMCATLVLLLLVAPSLARAATLPGTMALPVCESHELSRTPVEWLAPLTMLPDACSLGEIRDDDDPGDPRVAAMCSENGASVVAPGRVLPVVDARIDAAPGCGGELSAPVIGPAPKGSPVGPPAFALADDAVLGAAVLVLPASSELGPPFPAAAGAERAGVKHGIDHPPR